MENLLTTFLGAVIISIQLGLLMFGAYFFHHLLQSAHQLDEFSKKVSHMSSRLSVAMVFTWFLGAFMEGIAGFGIPAMLIAPLLLTMNFKPLTCIVFPLAANTTAVTFGALGTPLKIGLGITEPEPVVWFTLALNSVPAFLMPFALAFLYSKTEQIELEWRREFKMLCGAGVCFAVIYILTGLFTIEYTSVAVGSLGLFLFMLLFTPATERPSPLLWWNSFWPYILLVAMLLASKPLLNNVEWRVHEDLKSVSLYQPGLIFLITGFAFLQISRKPRIATMLGDAFIQTIQKIKKSVLIIFCLVILTQFLQSGILFLIKKFTSEYPADFVFFYAPVMGVIGSFLTGSATMSNLLFGDSLTNEVMQPLLVSLSLALLNTGSAIGNAISLQNVVMVKSVVNLDVGIMKVVVRNLPLIGCYLLIVISIAMIILSAL